MVFFFTMLYFPQWPGRNAPYDWEYAPQAGFPPPWPIILPLLLPTYCLRIVAVKRIRKKVTALRINTCVRNHVRPEDTT
ncbi:uncharacterized protein EI90DRAFT_3150346 [Cantharellus anzutake]|uniref:uncharacterized protein n=1 Tax=Cantharellus anzutake TaxID=1750568 RepID=UPI0019043A40|nr:uncharacterized protein EI90DRAFT_3150346 [Cantharellus anzutake]KAF8342296.1 hypothetical protein EI90DRAFT_3150346 [Cantharellus anzutake]